MERTGASVFVRSEIDIDASPRRVWAVLADIEGWPDWYPAVRSAELDGDLEMSTPFRWAAGVSTNSSVIEHVDAPKLLTWRGRTLGVKHRQEWHIERRDAGCHVVVEQALAGLPARVLAARLRQSSQMDLDTWLRLLKLEAERGTGEDG